MINTNATVPGLATPSGLAGGLRAGETMAQALRVPIARPVGVLSQTCAFPLASVAARVAVGGLAGASVAVAWEAGVAVGSAIDAVVLDPCGAF